MTSEQSKAARHLELGLEGEEAARRFLKKKGFSLLDLNWRPALTHGQKAAALELDIVAQEGKMLVFVEVKTRSISRAEPLDPLSVLRNLKAGRLRDAAAYYLGDKDYWDKSCRFDLICVSRFPDGRLELEHYRDVLDFYGKHNGKSGGSSSPPAGGGYTPWQPW